jgi:hypothetical protein
MTKAAKKLKYKAAIRYWQARLKVIGRGLRRHPAGSGQPSEARAYWLGQYKRAVRGLFRNQSALERLNKPKVPANKGGWHAKAKRVPYSGAGRFVSGYPARLVWHTTEGSSLPSYGGSAPHFTIDVKRRKLYQHYPIDVASRALMHPRSPETNNAHAIQVEIIGFSDASAARRWGHSEFAVENFTDADYAYLAKLARWIEKYAGVKRTGHGLVYQNRSHPMSDSAWVRFDGHCGHQHVPQNSHWDPSGAFRIDKVLA